MISRDEAFALHGNAAYPATTTLTGDQTNTAVAVNPDGTFTVAFVGSGTGP